LFFAGIAVEAVELGVAVARGRCAGRNPSGPVLEHPGADSSPSGVRPRKERRIPTALVGRLSGGAVSERYRRAGTEGPRRWRGQCPLLSERPAGIARRDAGAATDSQRAGSRSTLRIFESKRPFLPD
jgi:hypothetical protein